MFKFPKIFKIVFILVFILSGNLPIFALSPEVETLPATSIEKNSAVLNGSLLSVGEKEIQSAGFEYGKTISYGDSISAELTFTEKDSFGSTGSGDGELSAPVDLTFDSSGNMYVVDSGNCRIQKFDSSGNYLSQFGTCGSADGEFGDLSGSKIMIDVSGNIYVIYFDLNTLYYDIQKFDSSGNYISKFGAIGSGNGEFYDPKDIGIDSSGNIYVVDSGNCRIQKFDSSGNYLSQFGTCGSGNGEFSSPTDIKIDSSGNIYVSDNGSTRIQKFDSSGNYLSQFLQTGGSRIAIDPFDNLFVVASSRVDRFDSDGNATPYFSTGFFANDIEVDSDINFYLVDSSGNRIVKYSQDFTPTTLNNLDCGEIYYFRAFAQNEDGIDYGDGESFTTSDCQPPEEVLTLSASNISQNSVILNGFVNINSEIITKIGFDYGLNQSYGEQAEIEYVQDVGMVSGLVRRFTISPNGNVLILGQQLIEGSNAAMYDSNGEYISNIGFNGLGDGGFEGPYDIETDTLGNIYVSDSYFNEARIQKFNSSGNYLSQFGTYGSGDGEFANPHGIEFDSAGNIYIVDRSNHRIQKFDSSGNYLSQFGTYGSRDGEFDNPTDIAIDLSGNIYILDNGNRIQKFDPSHNWIFSVLSDIDELSTIAVDSQGNFYVSGTNSETIEKYSGSGVYVGSILIDPNITTSPSAGGANDIFIDDNDNLFISVSGDKLYKLNSTFSTTISGLTCNTTYHFRAFATNNDGTGYGDDLTFTTSACTSSGGGGSSGGSGSTPTNPIPVLGCTDPDATNYNSFANQDNGSCLYTPGAIEGCTDPSAGNYSSIATVDNGSCLYGVFDCTDPSALNYNSSADYSDGSCQYEGGVPPNNPSDPNDTLGCTDVGATNYNPLAVQDDGSCDYLIPVVFGCTDVSASNYEEEATQDNGSCAYINIPGPNTFIEALTSAVLSVSSFVKNIPEPVKNSIPVVGIAVPMVSLGFLQPGVFAGALIRLWNLIPVLLGYQRKKRPWGTVYDSVTKQPLDPVYVSLKTSDGQEIATSITDIDGRYGFLTSPGVYKITANKKDYIFPSQKLTGKTSDVLYDNLYFGEDLNVVQKDEVLFKNIPMDAINFNWNEFEKAKNKKLMRFYSKRDLFLAKVSNFLFVTGFGSSIALTYFNQSALNIIVLSIYVIILVLRLFGVKPKQAGYVFDKEGNPLSFGIVRLYSKLLNREVGHTVLGQTGKYYLLAPNGEYYLKISQKTGEDTYQDVFETESFKVRGGYVGKRFKIHS